MSRADVIGVLVAGKAPEALADRVLTALGADAAQILRGDPWRLLDTPGLRPDQVDAFARALLGPATQPDDHRRATALARWQLSRAAAEGNTALPAETLVAALTGSGLADPAAALAAAAASGLVVSAPADPSAAESAVMFALADLAAAEEAVAEGLERLVVTVEPLPGLPFGDAGVSVVIAPYPGAGTARRLTAEAEEAYATHGHRVVRASARDLATRLGVLAAAEVAVVDDAELLDVPTTAALLEVIPDGHRLVLVGDPQLLPPRGPGQVLADLVASGAVPVREEPPRTDGSRQIADLVLAVRHGVLPDLDDLDRSVVVVPCDDATAVTRTLQLVTDSIPRVIGTPAEEVLVVSPRMGGVAGVSALDDALSQRLGTRDTGRVRTISDAHGSRADAVVAVLPAEAAQWLNRALVATAFGLAVRHLSVVAAAGPAFREAVERGGDHPRSTRLAGLLR